VVVTILLTLFYSIAFLLKKLKKLKKSAFKAIGATIVAESNKNNSEKLKTT